MRAVTYDVVIVGGGHNGLTAAAYLARAGLTVVVLEKNSVVGGAAMALAYNTRRLTAHVDGVFEPKSAIYDASRAVAQDRLGLPVDWLNDAVKGLLPGADRDLVDVLAKRINTIMSKVMLGL